MIAAPAVRRPPRRSYRAGVVRRVTLHGFTVEVVAPRLAILGAVATARALAVALGGYPTATATDATDLRITMRVDEDDRWSVDAGDVSYPGIAGAERAAQQAEWLIVSRGIARWTRFVHVHAAAVATPRQTLLLVGQSGSGKSTTSVALALSGLTLYTDDVALIDRETLRPVAVPRPIKLDGRSRRLLRPMGLALPRRVRLRESVARRALPGPPPVEIPGPPVGTIVFVAGERGPAPTIRPLTGAEAVMRLVVQSASERFRESGPSTGAVALVNAVRCHELTAGALGPTVEAIRALIGADSGEGSAPTR